LCPSFVKREKDNTVGIKLFTMALLFMNGITILPLLIRFKGLRIAVSVKPQLLSSAFRVKARLIILAIALMAFTAIACKKEKTSGRKCVWNVILNNRVAYEWLEKPSSDQVKQVEISCSCTVTVNEVCFSCNTSVTTASGIDVQCK
jgi:hypothetical protein